MTSDKAILPSLDHTNLTDWTNVYEPSDDTFLLCDALLNDKDIISSINPLIISEIGCGSATDINPYALELTNRTAQSNKCKIDTIRTTFLNSLQVDKKIDILLFNPPYVPTDNNEVNFDYLTNNYNCIEASWAGGENGRLIINQFLPLISTYLSHNGICYLVLVQENNPNEISQILLSYGLQSQIIIKRQAYNENLQIMRIKR
eukprot:gene17554-23118_t